MIEDFPKLNAELSTRWWNAAMGIGLPSEQFVEDVKILESPNSDYTFGVFLNRIRSKRPMDNKANELACPLCLTIEETITNPERAVDSSRLPGYIVVPNSFPDTFGHSLAITEGTGDYQTPMYTTRDLSRFAEQMHNLFSYCTTSGFLAFQNGPGAGATIPNHEHTHLTNWSVAFSKAESLYGVEAASLSQISSTPEVRQMPGLPFAHLVFKQDDVDRIESFLSSLHKSISHKYEHGFVPHTISQGREGILITPFKNYMDKDGIGCGYPAGHNCVGDEELFKNITYEDCLDRLRTQMFTKDEINLDNFL